MPVNDDAYTYHLVWNPRKSSDLKRQPGRTHLVSTHPKYGIRLCCGKKLSKTYLNQSECLSVGVTMPRAPTAEIWPTCDICCGFWMRILEDQGVSHEPKLHGWTIEWEEEAGIRPHGAYDEWKRHIAELHEMIRGRGFGEPLGEPSIIPPTADIIHNTDGLPTATIAEFLPKSSADYIVSLPATEQVRHRAHEDLILRYGTWITTQSYKPNTKCHPIDLIITQDNRHILVEAKIIQNESDTLPARESIGQLYEYRHRYFQNREVPLALLLNRQIKPDYVLFLESLQISCVWSEVDTWHGSPTAVEHGIAVAY